MTAPIAAELAMQRARTGAATPPRGAAAPVNANADGVASRRDIAKRGPEIVAKIWELRNEPLVPLEIGEGPIASVYLGGIALLNGGTGTGKTSLAMEVAIRHAVHRGPALVVSLELPDRIIGARIVGIRCDASWTSVLGGEVSREHMLGQWPERLRIIERRDATIDNVTDALMAIRREYPGEPPLVVVDYVQIMDNEEREIRRRVAKAMEALAKLAEDNRAVVLALSQGSRSSSRQLAGGSVGRETADAGAEAAELERWSVCTIAIGGHAPADGEWCAVDLSIGKGRIGGGDMVFPARYCGRNGAWRLAGDARAAADVRAEHQATAGSKRRTALENELIGAAYRAPEPLAKEKLVAQVKGQAAAKRAALAGLIERGLIVEVVRRAQRSKSWLVWAPERAAAAGIAVAPREQLEQPAEPGGSNA